MNEQYERYLKSDAWEEKRQIVLKRDKNMCRECGSKFNLQVHHMTYFHIFNERTYELVTLCEKCHNEIHTKHPKFKLPEEKVKIKPKKKKLTRKKPIDKPQRP